MQKNTRLPYVDIAKGVAMLLVIIGHCSYSEKGLVGWLYSFHMPLFFALSGFTFRPEKYKSLREVIAAKFRQLIIPYFVFNVLLWVLNLLLLDGLKIEYRHINEFIGIVLSKRLSKYFFNLWFLTTLFLAEPVLWCILHLTRRRALPLALLSIAAYCAGAFVLRFVEGTYWSADLVPIALSFLALGYLARVLADRRTVYTVRPLLFAWGVNLLFFYLNHRQFGRSDLYFCKLGNPLFFFLSSCGGIAGTLLLCQRISRCAALEYIGKNSIVFYAFESLAIPLSERLLCAVLGVSALQAFSLCAALLVLALSCGMLSLASSFYCTWKRWQQMRRRIQVFS